MAGNGASGKGRIMSPWPPPTIAPLKVNRRRRALVVAIGVTDVVLLCVLLLLGVYGHYETTHDIPNPFWTFFNGTLTYTPEQGPPAGLFRSRPDEITRQALTDYIRVAGTFPCAEDLDTYDLYNDPFLLRKQNPCTVTRPVASFAITSVTMVRGGSEHGTFFDVHFRVVYADGQSHDFSIFMIPHQHDTYWLTMSNMDCWDGALSDLYPDIVPQVPPGVAYYGAGPNGGEVTFRCHASTGADITL